MFSDVYFIIDDWNHFLQSKNFLMQLNLISKKLHSIILVRQGKLTYSDVLVAQILKKEKKRISFLRTVKTQSVSATFHNEAFINTLEENASKPVPMSFQSIYFCLSGMIQLHNLLRPKAD